ncbi:MAG TPA: type I 3-dehydroquinate dehydratase [Bacteroidia bacterium]|jgi:3-dehydroquinate dehydratase-1|nr:type I 3-dehydroquinate dehydratase [Bacteroidia bacterium]
MSKEFKICTVIQGKNLETFVKNLKKAQKTAMMIELRADSIKDFDADDIEIIQGLVKLPSIFTCRHVNEGGLFESSMAKQEEILLKAFSSGFTYVDVAFNNPAINDLTDEDKSRLLISYHNNKGTPILAELVELLKYMRTFNPAIMKIATMVKDKMDVPILASLLRKRKKDEKLIVIGMGKKGEITRLTFPPAGSYIAYVTMKGEKNMAPGMLTEKDLQPMFNYLNK